ncbi:MAG: hypothetical protein JW384_01118 [Nitrosomonadaceae bacterium]|nr:hypothetical protein [Nitrosomonadaceae bacterium]
MQAFRTAFLICFALSIGAAYPQSVSASSTPDGSPTQSAFLFEGQDINADRNTDDVLQHESGQRAVTTEGGEGQLDKDVVRLPTSPSDSNPILSMSEEALKASEALLNEQRDYNTRIQMSLDRNVETVRHIDKLREEGFRRYADQEKSWADVDRLISQSRELILTKRAEENSHIIADMEELERVKNHEMYRRSGRQGRIDRNLTTNDTSNGVLIFGSSILVVLVILILFGIVLLWIVLRTIRYNNDPTQQALAGLIIGLEIDPSGPSSPGEKFVMECLTLLSETGGSASARLSHALSLARSHVTAKTYEEVKHLFSTMSSM